MALLSRTLCAKVEASGNLIIARVLDVNEDMLLEMARQHVSKHGLGWRIHEPQSWRRYKIGPHVTLTESMRTHVGEYLPVKLRGLSHFIDAPSRWVVFVVELPAKFRCEYECHLSIGQDRFQ